jgi:hypothetical protein
VSQPSKWEVYHCPVTSLYFDPFRVLHALHHYAGKKLNELIDGQADPDVALKLAAVGRRAFKLGEVNPGTGTGYPDAQVLACVEAFSEYVRGKGLGAGNWRDYSASSDSRQTSAPKNCSDCP